MGSAGKRNNFAETRSEQSEHRLGIPLSAGLKQVKRGNFLYGKLFGTEQLICVKRKSRHDLKFFRRVFLQGLVE